MGIDLSDNRISPSDNIFSAQEGISSFSSWGKNVAGDECKRIR